MCPLSLAWRNTWDVVTLCSPVMLHSSSSHVALLLRLTFQAVAQGWGERAQPGDTSEVGVLYRMHPTQPSAP